MDNDTENLEKMQKKFLAGAALLAPVAPFLFLQGRITRWKVGVLPDAAGERRGRIGGEGEAVKLYVTGESTVAGLGARDHEKALAGQFARHLSLELERPVEWQVFGRNGVTARRVIDELLPEMPDERFDYVLLGIGGNDVMKLSSPRKWRRDMTELLTLVRKAQPEATIFISNCPMICWSPVIPEPSRGLLWQLSQMHQANLLEFIRAFDRVQYYPQPDYECPEGFFADGIHPSEAGYDAWARDMVATFFQSQ